MNALLLLMVSVAGGLGAALRFTVDAAVTRHVAGSFPLGTFLVNVTGSFLIGVLAGVIPAGGEFAVAHAAIATGLLGGYTTFSTASFETIRLLQNRRWGFAAVHSLGLLVVCVAAALGGFALGVAAVSG